MAWSVSPDNNRAPGRTCMRACRRLARGLPLAARRPWPAPRAAAPTCGSPRSGCSPGSTWTPWPALAQLQAGLTHGHPTGAGRRGTDGVRRTAAGTGRGDPGRPAGGAAGPLRIDQRHVYRADWLGDLWQAPAPRPRHRRGRSSRSGWDECLRGAGPARRRAGPARPGHRPVPGHRRRAGSPRRRWPPRCTARCCSRTTRCRRSARAATTPATPTRSPAWPAPSTARPTAWPPGPPEWAGRIEYAAELAALGALWD